jgi:hypothetical protein
VKRRWYPGAKPWGRSRYKQTDAYAQHRAQHVNATEPGQHLRGSVGRRKRASLNPQGKMHHQEDDQDLHCEQRWIGQIASLKSLKPW